MGKTRQAQLIVDYQARGAEFSVGDIVVPIGVDSFAHSGRAVAVFPAIGMVDVEFAWGSQRFPVEDLNIIEKAQAPLVAPEHDSVPGNAEKVSVSGGPYPPKGGDIAKMASRVAEAFIVQSVMGSALRRGKIAADGREYCPDHTGEALRPMTFRRKNGQVIPLVGCPKCAYTIRSGG